MRTFLAVAVVVGIVAPYAALVPFLVEHGLDLPLLAEEATANRIATFAWVDVVVSAAVLLAVAFGSDLVTFRQAVWVSVATCLVGVSAGLPLLFLFALGGRGGSDRAVSARFRKPSVP